MNMLRAVLCIVFGIGLMIVGITSLDDTEVMCGDEVLSPGEICETTKRGEVTDENSYEEEAELQAMTPYVMMGLSPILVIGGIIWVVTATRKNRSAASEEPEEPEEPEDPRGGPPQQGYGHQPYPQGPPPQGYPQQPPPGYGQHPQQGYPQQRP